MEASYKGYQILKTRDGFVVTHLYRTFPELQAATHAIDRIA